MNVFQCNPTEISPLVHINPENGELTIEGNAIPDDAEAFFTPILEWLDEYIKNTTVKTTLNLKLHYFNVSSSKRILFIFYKTKGELNRPLCNCILVNCVDCFYNRIISKNLSSIYMKTSNDITESISIS